MEQKEVNKVVKWNNLVLLYDKPYLKALANLAKHAF